MWLAVGLGNPGPAYRLNRHNIGFVALDAIVRRHLPGLLAWRGRFQGEALKPQTFMNNSGTAVREACDFYKIAIERVIVLHDDLDLAPGRIELKRGGGHGGHNGLKSIDSHIGKDYRRIRIGIGHPVPAGVSGMPPGVKQELVSNYVLGNFGKAEQATLEPKMGALIDAFPLILQGRDNEFRKTIGQ